MRDPDKPVLSEIIFIKTHFNFMNSPFTDFIDVASETLTGNVTDAELKSPLIDHAGLNSEFMSEEEDENIVMESELTGTQLSRAVEYNEKYKKLYKWEGFIAPILTMMGVQAADFAGAMTDPKKFAQVFAAWQEKNGFKTTLPGVLGINNWTYFQKQLKFHNLSNKHNINISKAISDNSYYSKKLWGSDKENVYRYLQSFKILAGPWPLNDEYFAYAIADFQALKGLKTDGILGPITWTSLKNTPRPTPLPSTPTTPSTPSKWQNIFKDATRCAASPLFYGEDTFARMSEAIKATSGANDYIYIMGWTLDVDFNMTPDDTLLQLLQKAGSGVEIRVLIWDNHLTSSEVIADYHGRVNAAFVKINALRSTKNIDVIMLKDNATFGSPRIKAAVQEIQKTISGIPSILERNDTWRNIKNQITSLRNEGSHHEKIVIVKNKDGLTAFFGGIDINHDRVYYPDQNGKNQQLRDVHCMVNGDAARDLLKRFKMRWDVYTKHTRSTNFLKLRGEKDLTGTSLTSSTVPNSVSAFVKIKHTYNHPSEYGKDRSIRDALQVAIQNAESTIYFEDQYLISLEIAGWLNKKLKEPNFKYVYIVTNDDSTVQDLKFPSYLRKRFIDKMCEGLSQPDKDKKVIVNMMNANGIKHERHYVHSKLYIIDANIKGKELVIIGSANCNRRSMTNDSETAAVIFNSPDDPQTFGEKLRVKMNYGNVIPNLVKYVSSSLDLDVKILAVAKAESSILPAGSLIYSAVEALVAPLKAAMIDVIDPQADDTTIQRETYEDLLPAAELNENLVSDFEMMENGPFAYEHNPVISAGISYPPDVTREPETENFSGFSSPGILSVKGYEDPGNSGVLLKKVDDRNAALSKNFTVGEFAQNVEGKYKWDYYRLDNDLITELQILRDMVGKPVIILDGYYPPKYQTEILKKPLNVNDPHFSGRGARIRIEGMTGLQVAESIVQFCDQAISVSFGEATAAVYVKQPQMPRITSYMADPVRKEQSLKSLEALDRKVKASIIQVKDIVEETIPDALVNLLSPANDIRIIDQAMKESRTILDEALAVIDRFLLGKPGTDQAAGYMKMMKNFTKLSEDIYKMSPGSDTQKFADLLKSDTSGLDFLTKIQLLKNTFGIIESITKLSSITEKKKKYEEFLKSTPGAYFYLSVDILEGATKLTSDTVSLGFAIAASLAGDAATKTELISKAINFEKALKPVVIFIEGLKIIRSIANIVVAIGRGDYKTVTANLIDIGKALATIYTIVRFGGGVVAGITFIYEYYKFMLVTLPGMVGDVVRNIAQGSTIVALRELNAQFKFVTRKYLQISLNYEKILKSLDYDDSKLVEYSNLQSKAYSYYTFLHRTLYDFDKYVRELYHTTRSSMQYYSSFPSIPIRFYTTAGQSKLMFINTVLQNYPKRPEQLDFVYINALNEYYSFLYEGVVKCNLEAKPIYEERVQVGWGNDPYNLEVGKSSSEISFEGEANEMDRLIGQEAGIPVYEMEPETEDLSDTSGFYKEDEHSHKPCRCRKKTSRHSNHEMEIAEAIEHQVAVVAKTCESLNCWAKSVLNRELSLNLPDTNTMGEEEKKALIAFQVKNNLPQTGKLNFVTERALLEADAIQRSKGTATESAALNIISSAKTRVEDWTAKGLSGVKTKPQYILNSFRDPRKVWAFVLHQMAFKRMGRVSRKYSDPESYINTGAHFCILLDGRIIQLHPLSRMIWHGNCVSPRSVAVEFEGNFPNVQGRWWVDSTSSVQNKDVPTQAQYDSGKFLTSYLKVVLGTTHILAHRQSSDSRENDPGPDIWYNVGQWAIDNLGLTDGGPAFKCGTGNPILPAWRTWGNKTVPVKEFAEYNEESEETEWQSEDENYTDDLTIEPETDYDSYLSPEMDSYEESFAEMEELLNDLPNAVAKNRYYADKLGWNQYQYKINDLLLPYSGQQNVSLGEEAFAQAVAAWQQQQGFASKDCDGIIGPNTWARMKSLLFAQPTITTSPTPVGTLPAKIDSNVLARLKGFSTDIESVSKQHGLNPNIVRGIIAAESGGNPDSGKGTSGYKGLMQAERTIDQLQPGTSIQTGVAKFILFRDKILNPWLVKLQISIPLAADEIYLKACLSCYNAGPVTAMKAIQYAHAAGNWKNWLSAEYYLRALLFSGGYDKYSKCNQGLSTTEINAAKTEGLKYKFKTSGWRTEPDPPAWSSVIAVLNPVTRCWIETKFTNTPGYLDRFIGYFKYFENNPQPPQPEVADEFSMYEEYDTPVENFDDEDLELENSVSFEEESFPSQANWVGQDNEDVFGHEDWEQATETPSTDHESFVEQILQFLKPGVIAEKVKQFLSENYFNLSLISKFASGQIWNEDHIALEILFHRNPKLKPAKLDKLPETERLKELHKLAFKHRRVLKPLVDSIVRPLFGNPANFQIPPIAEPCQIQNLRPDVTKLGPLEGGKINGVVWYKRDARMSPRDLSKIDSIIVHHMAYNLGNDVGLYKKVGAQYIVTADGQIAQLYDDLDYLNSSNGFNPRCIAIEFAGNFPDIRYNWWPTKKTTPSRSYLTPSQIQAGRCLLAELKARYPGIKYLYAHRQSYANKEGDPGPDVWFNIAEWAINKFGLTDRLPSPKVGSGQPIPDKWRLARPITLSAGTSAPKLISKEDEYWNEAEEEEIESEEYAMQSDESINEEWNYTNEMQEEMFDESGESFEIDEQVTNWSKAIELNRSYGVRLGWNQSHDQINDLLLPYSGQQNVSLGEEAFAQAVAAWQQQQGLTADGVIGPNTWSKMKVMLISGTPTQPVQPAPLPTGITPPPVQNIFDFNRWHAKRIVDTMNAGIIGTNFNSKDQLEKIVRGEQVLNVNPQTKIIQILPIMYHIAEQARLENYREIIFGSFIRPPSGGKCTGHCVGKCIDINHTKRSFETSDSIQMVTRILKYLLSLPVKYKSSIGFGMPLQGNFFGHKSLTKFKGTDPSNLIDSGLQSLVRQLGYIFPDNDNHIHIQVNWLTEGVGSKHEVWGADPKEPEMENFTLAQKIDMVRSWKDLLLYKVPDTIVQQLRKRNMYVQYAHNQSYSGDLNTDFYSVRILQYPTINGVQMNAQSLIRFIRLNINVFVDTSYCDFQPYNAAIDAPLWKSDNPLGAVLKLDIKGPDNAAVVVSWVGKYGWQFSTIYAPDTGKHPVSGQREFYIINKPSDGKAPMFAIKGLDAMSTGVAGLGFPILGAWGFAQGDALWKSMQARVLYFINKYGGKAIKDETYSERVEWRFVYRQYKNVLEQTFGKGAGSAENSSFFNFQLEDSER